MLCFIGNLLVRDTSAPCHLSRHRFLRNRERDPKMERIAKAIGLVCFGSVVSFCSSASAQQWQNDINWCYANHQAPSLVCATAWAHTAPACVAPGAGGKHCVIDFAILQSHGDAVGEPEGCGPAFLTAVSCQCDAHNAAGRAHILAAGVSAVCSFLQKHKP